MTDFNEYETLADQGRAFGGSAKTTPPEQDFFHSVYISGKTRENHIGVKERAGEFQIRGVEYNLDEVNMIIVHVKDILVKELKQQAAGRTSTIECTSFKEGAGPWYGSTKLENGNPRPCPSTSHERSLNSFCSSCRSQLIVAGIYCKPDGSPVLNEEMKPLFIFLRGKGIKYKNVADYLATLYNENFEPIFEPPSEASKKFEKEVVNYKRVITKITKGTATSNFGDKDVFVLTENGHLPKEVVKKILELAKNTIEKFNDKFNWAKVKVAKPDGILEMTADKPQPKKEESKQPAPKPAFDFDSIKF